MSFAELGLAAPLLRALDAQGYSTPTPIQAQAIPPALEGRDVLGCAQTGTGKTAAFALPLLQRLMESGPVPVAPQPQEQQSSPPPRKGGRRLQGRRFNDRPVEPYRPTRVLVLAPTRELAVQISESFRDYGAQTGLKWAAIFGGVGYQPQIQALRRGVDILVATPGRLVDLIQQGYCDLSTVEAFVLDEADRMLDMGFMPDLRRIIDQLPEKKQTLFFSATMPPEIAKLADDLLVDPFRIDIAPTRPAAERIDQSVCFVPKSFKSQLLIRWIADHAIERAIVFSRTKHGADRIAKHLEEAGITADAIHGNKSQNARQRTLQAFRTSELQVLVATDLAARGIDVDGISHVFNYDLPIEPETYVHRIGRTARAGASGIAVSFCDRDERGMLRSIERLLKRALPIISDLPIHVPQATHAAEFAGDSRGPRPPQGRRPQGSRPPQHGSRPPQHGSRPPQQGARPAQQGSRPAEGGPRPQRPPRPVQSEGQSQSHAQGHGTGTAQVGGRPPKKFRRRPTTSSR